MSGRKRGSSVSVGHDAFLDIVANLVGILIILVVVLGAQSQKVLREARVIDETPPEIPETKISEPEIEFASENDMQELASVASRAAAAQADSNRLEQTIKILDQKIAQESERRTVLLALLQEAEAVWEEQQEKLDEDRKLAAIRDAERKELQKELDKIEGESEALEGAEPPVVAVSHLPTPMAKTVFGKEIHFRLKGNRLSVVPIDALTEEIKRDVRRMISGSREGVMDAAIGPVRGYVARYVMNRDNRLVPSGNKIRHMATLQVMAASFEPLSEPHGIPMERVLGNDDWLDIELAGHQANATTITVWVYPDSYGAFRKLKEKLYAKGFPTAARPLEKDRPIIASAAGSRSTAQ